MLNRAISRIAIGLVISTAGFAQFELGSVVGTVKDSTGLPMANAAVEIRSLATNIARQSMTSGTGEFDFVALHPGQYSLTAKQSGFKETTQNFELAVGQRVELNISMEVGAA